MLELPDVDPRELSLSHEIRQQNREIYVNAERHPTLQLLLTEAGKRATALRHHEVSDVHVISLLCEAGPWSEYTPSYFAHLVKVKGGDFVAFRQTAFGLLLEFGRVITDPLGEQREVCPTIMAQGNFLGQQ